MKLSISFVLYTPVACVGKHIHVGVGVFFAYNLFAVFSGTMLGRLRVCYALRNPAVFSQYVDN